MGEWISEGFINSDSVNDNRFESWWLLSYCPRMCKRTKTVCEYQQSSMPVSWISQWIIYGYHHQWQLLWSYVFLPIQLQCRCKDVIIYPVNDLQSFTLYGMGQQRDLPTLSESFCLHTPGFLSISFVEFHRSFSSFSKSEFILTYTSIVSNLPYQTQFSDKGAASCFMTRWDYLWNQKT